MPETATPPPAPALPVRVSDDVMERLRVKPVFQQINPTTFDFIKKQIAPDCTNAEIGHFLELCVHYQLDPFVHEAWIAKGRGDNGRILIMVGRDGLRKIAHRNGRDVQCDVVRADDDYSAEYIGNAYDAEEGEWEAHGSAPFHRIIHKRKGMGSARGEITGAWCVVTDSVTRREVGWSEAPIEEYMPTSEAKLRYSPWGSQVSVMIMAAAERNALRQATPLSGLLAVGEDARIAREDLTEGEGKATLPEGVPLSPAIEEIIARAEAVGHAGYANRMTWEMQVKRPEQDVEQLVREAHAELDRFQAAELADAEVVADDRELPIDDADLPEPTAPTPADVVEFYDVPGKNERWYIHEGCDGIGAKWVEPLDDAPAPTETECAQCMSVYPVVRAEVTDVAAPAEAPVAEPAPEPPPAASKTKTAAQAQGESLARLKARRKLYEELDAVTEEEQAEKDRELDALDRQIRKLEAAGASDEPDQGSLL